MARTRKTSKEALEEKIEKAEVDVIAAKKKYDQATANLKELLGKWESVIWKKIIDDQIACIQEILEKHLLGEKEECGMTKSEVYFYQKALASVLYTEDRICWINLRYRRMIYALYRGFLFVREVLKRDEGKKRTII